MARVWCVVLSDWSMLYYVWSVGEVLETWSVILWAWLWDRLLSWTLYIEEWRNQTGSESLIGKCELSMTFTGFHGCLYSNIIRIFISAQCPTEKHFLHHQKIILDLFKIFYTQNYQYPNDMTKLSICLTFLLFNQKLCSLSTIKFTQIS